MLGPVVEAEEVAIDELIRRLEEGVFSFTWQLDEETRTEAGPRVRAWAESRFGSLDRPRRHESRIAYRAYDLA
jgi:hypothetical protein